MASASGSCWHGTLAVVWPGTLAVVWPLESCCSGTCYPQVSSHQQVCKGLMLVQVPTSTGCSPFWGKVWLLHGGENPQCHQ